VGSVKVLENYSWGPGKVLEKSWISFSVKEWEPWMLYLSDVKSLLTAIQDNSIVQHDDVAVMDECLTPPHSSLNSSTGSPCSTVTDSQGPQSPLFQEDLSPVAIEGTVSYLMQSILLIFFLF